MSKKNLMANGKVGLTQRGPKQKYNHDPVVTPAAGKKNLAPKNGPQVVRDHGTFNVITNVP